jgi:uncharacterized protein YwqG
MPSLKELQALVPKIVKPVFQEDILAAILPSVRLKTTEKVAPTAGGTKLGGVPDFHPGQTWPTTKVGKPMAFTAQINMKEVAPFDVNELMPKIGILYFFYDWEGWLGGAVQYFPEEKALSPAIPPEYLTRERKSWWQNLFNRPGRNMMLSERGVSLTTEYYLPSYDSIWAELLMAPSKGNAIHDMFVDDFWEETDYFEELDKGSNHHLLGHYQGIQHNGYETELVDTGKNPFRRQTTKDLEAASQWLLLFQLDSDNALDFCIGDWGRAYFFIHRDDLKNRRFERVRVMGDCY